MSPTFRLIFRSLCAQKFWCVCRTFLKMANVCAATSGVKSTRKLLSSKSFVTDEKLLEVKYKVLTKKVLK